MVSMLFKKKNVCAIFFVAIFLFTLNAEAISVLDEPVGFSKISIQSEEGVVVRTKAELLGALKNGGLIFVDGKIDMTDGMVPSSAGGSTSALDEFVSRRSGFSSYEEFKKAYATSCSLSTEDGSSSKPESSHGALLWRLNKSYGKIIELPVKSGTTLIGQNNAVIIGGSVKIAGVSNVVIRNITMQDAYDPFPHHESNDGFNAQHDAVSITNSSDIWIDHCTFFDSLGVGKVKNKDGKEEKWQTYDGLCDITKDSKNVVVSYCVFQNHDKTMLIGSGSKDVSGGKISIHHNRFVDCGQRLPLTAYSEVHIFNNSYEQTKNAVYKQNSSIALRYSATVVAEGNHFGKGVKKSITISGSAGKCFLSENVFLDGKSQQKGEKKKTFEIPYSYTLDDAKNLPVLLTQTAGAGKLPTKQ